MPFCYFKSLVLIVAGLAQAQAETQTEVQAEIQAEVQAEAQAEKTPSERCPTEQNFTIECNRCWCLNNVPVCTRMDCKLVPKELWGKVPTLVPVRQQRIFLLGILTTVLGAAGAGLVGLIGTGATALAGYVGMKIAKSVVGYVVGKIG